MQGFRPRMDHQTYGEMVKKATPNSSGLLGILRAFWVGGLICAIGQLIREFGDKVMLLSPSEVGALTACTLIFLGALLTGVGVYDRIGKYAGGGSVVPITGFANSIVAPAMEFKREGYVMGVGAKLFSLAGPVLVYGITSSVIVGLLYYLFGG